MKQILIENCGECPVVIKATCGTKLNCGHTKTLVNRPYAKDREVKVSEFPKFCPLESYERSEPVIKAGYEDWGPEIFVP